MKYEFAYFKAGQSHPRIAVYGYTANPNEDDEAYCRRAIGRLNTGSDPRDISWRDAGITREDIHGIIEAPEPTHNEYGEIAP